MSNRGRDQIRQRLKEDLVKPMSHQAVARYLADALWSRQAAFRDKALLIATLETALAKAEGR